MKVAVLQFPGSNGDQDTFHLFASGLGLPTRYVWHKETSLRDAEVVALPGGFAHGDYLRCGAIARFSPIMKAVREFANRGGLVLGICNGFQVLCEAGLLPGALIRNSGLEFRCVMCELAVEHSLPTFSPAALGPSILLPISHGEGNYRIDPDGLTQLEANNQILLRYAHNPNGSLGGIAGIRNKAGNVFGLMPHPDRAFERFHSSRDGLPFARAVLATRFPEAIIRQSA